MIETPQTASVRCDAIVDLISRVQRPYVFRVTVVGWLPHRYLRIYTIAANDDDSAANLGIETFVKEFSNPVIAQEMGTLVPKARLQ